MNALFPNDAIDTTLRAWANERGGCEQRWPALIPADTLKRAGYHEAFPHLLMTAAVCAAPEQSLDTLMPSAWCLSPAVCYHAYASLENQTLTTGVKLSARGICFRNEERSALVPGRRQIEFEMRELVLIGAPEWIEHELMGVREEIVALASQAGLAGDWQPASDPFFLPRAQGKAHMQRILGTKMEFCLPDGLAIASINRHGAFFGTRFTISLSNGQPAHSACVAFGLDRWASQSHPHSHHDPIH
jgi:hypothetical protein